MFFGRDKGKKGPPARQQPAPEGPRIVGQVDPQVLARVRAAVEVQAARRTVGTMAGDDEGARQLTNVLRRWMEER